MIIPVGKISKQQNQGLYKNDIFLNDLFKKSELPLGSDGGQANLGKKKSLVPPPEQETETPEMSEQTPEVPPDMQNAMNSSNNPSMNANNVPVGSEQPNGNSGNDDFAVISGEFSKFLGGSEKLQGRYVIVSQAHDQRKGSFTFVIEPAQKPELSGQPSQILVQK